MGKPAGVQIKRWLLILVAMLLIVNVISVVSLFLVYSYVNDIKSAYQPIANSSATINEKIMGAQVDLLKYLSEYQDNLSPVFNKTEELKKEINKIGHLVKDNDIGEKYLVSLNETLESTVRFEKAIRKLKETEKGAQVDWEKRDSLRRLAMDMATETQINATRMSNAVNILSRKQNIHVTMVTLGVVSTLFVFFIISIMIMIQLHYWWRKFEDLILDM